MKSKNILGLKGFTLVELLAVIVIIGLFALIATPVFMKVIETVKKNAFQNSTYGLVEAAKIYYSNRMVENNGYFEPRLFTVQGGKLKSGNEELPYKGKTPVGDSWVLVDVGGKISLNITDGTYFAVKDVGETGVEVTETEGGAVSRDELFARIESLEKRYKDLADKADEIEDNVGSSTGDITKLNNKVDKLTDKTSSDNIFLKTYPVGSIYVSTSNTNPGDIFGGSWSAYGQGRTLVGVGTGTDSNTVSKEFTAGSTGGEYNHTLSISQIPSHTHTFTGTAATTNPADASHQHPIPVLTGSTTTTGSHTHGPGTLATGNPSVSLTGTVNNIAVQGSTQGLSTSGIFSLSYTSGQAVGYAAATKANSATYSDHFSINAQHTHTVTSGATASSTHNHNISTTASNTTAAKATHSHTFTSAGSNSSVGGGTSHNNIQPYVTVYMWKRTS